VNFEDLVYSPIYKKIDACEIIVSQAYNGMPDVFMENEFLATLINGV